jgi:RNA polymerase sigma-70 factor (ECF subfamily)
MSEGERVPSATSESQTPSSDRSLLVRFREGSQDAATQLYRRYAQRLRELAQAQFSDTLARQLEADDIVQSVFGSFFRGASQGHYDVPDGEELWRLFLVIALNKVRARARWHKAAKRDVRRTAGGEGYEAALDRVAAEDDAAAALLQMCVDDAVAQLPEAHQKALRLRIEGYEVSEIAQMLGRSMRSTERQLQEARQKLAVLLAEDAPS